MPLQRSVRNKKHVQIGHLRTNTYLSFGVKIAKIGPVDPGIICLHLKKKLTQAKYIARLASLPSGLKNYTKKLQLNHKSFQQCEHFDEIHFTLYCTVAIACYIGNIRFPPTLQLQYMQRFGNSETRRAAAFTAGFLGAPERLASQFTG